MSDERPDDAAGEGAAPPPGAWAPPELKPEPPAPEPVDSQPPPPPTAVAPAADFGAAPTMAQPPVVPTRPPGEAVPPWNTTGVPAPAPVDAAPPPPPGGAQFGTPPPVQPRPVSPAGYRERWNWAAGCVIGLTALATVFALPQLLQRLDEGFWSFIDSSEWTMWAAAGVGLLAILFLASGTTPVVAVAATASAGLAIASMVLAEFWDQPAGYNTYFMWTLFGAFVLLGLLSAVCLRRVRRA